MTFKEYLISKGLTEEQAETITGGMAENKFFLASEEKLDERYAKMKSQKEQLETQLTTNQTELETLKETAKGNEELTKQLTELQTAFDNSKAESESAMKEQQKDFAIKLALKDSSTLDSDIVMSLINKESINVTDDGLHGLKDQLEKIQEEKPFLFQEKDPDPQNPATPKIVTPGNAKGKNADPADPFTAKLAKYE
jgi:glutamine synthetase adenylyltransferase